jgi:hypothetical protein
MLWYLCAKFRLAQLEGYTTPMARLQRRLFERRTPISSASLAVSIRRRCRVTPCSKEWSTPSVRRPKFVRNARLALPRHKTVVEWWDSWAI